MEREIIKVEKVNEVYMRLYCSDGIAREIWEKFSFKSPSAKYDPRVRSGAWDGFLREFSLATRQMTLGHLEGIEEFCRENNYELEYLSDFSKVNFSILEAEEFISTLNLPADRTPRDYQIDAFVNAVRNKRSLNLISTGAGKSLVFYILFRYYNSKTLLIVPTINLVDQMFKDFKDYGYDSDDNIHKIFAGQEKDSDKILYISTYQSLAAEKLSKGYFNKFEMVLNDEVHLSDGKSLKNLLTSMTKTTKRHGFTGTLNEKSKTNEMTLTGLFSKPRRAKTADNKDATTSELINQNYLSPLKIKILILGYSLEIRKHGHKLEYNDECAFVASYSPRNTFITNLALSLKGNTLVMFRTIEHGEELYKQISEKNKNPSRKIILIHGSQDKEGKEVRNNIKDILRDERDAIVVCSYGTMSTGANIPNINNLIFASAYKSQIKVMQSIGRSLRLSAGKNDAVLYDIADDLSHKTKKSVKRNTLLNHLVERVSMYSSENFPYKIYNIDLEEN